MTLHPTLKKNIEEFKIHNEPIFPNSTYIKSIFHDYMKENLKTFKLR